MARRAGAATALDKDYTHEEKGTTGALYVGLYADTTGVVSKTANTVECRAHHITGTLTAHGVSLAGP